MELVNWACNHGLRVLFPTDIQTSVCQADTAFDANERTISQPDSHNRCEPHLGTYPHASFVAVQDANHDPAVCIAGTHEHEVIDEAHRTIAITLLRAFGRGAGHPHEYVDNQELGPHTCRLGLKPYASTLVLAGVMQRLHEFSVSLITTETGRRNGSINPRLSLLRQQAEGIDVTAIKQSEERDTLLVRMVNLSENVHSVTLG